MASRLEGYFLIPHELLHVAGYRLVGRKCRYHLGNPFVTPLEPMTRREELVGLLFPFVVFVSLFLLLTVLSGLIPFIVNRQEGNGLLWVGLLGLPAFLAGVYACTTVEDLRRAYLILANKPPDSQTPFDFLDALYEQLQQADRPLIFGLIILSLAALVYTWPV